MSTPIPRLPVAAVEPRPAATTLIVRDGAPGLEVLMVKRSPTASFMPGAYVFPGGAVDAADGAPELVDDDPTVANDSAPIAAARKRPQATRKPEPRR